MEKSNKKFYDFVLSEDKTNADLYIFGEISMYRWYEEDVSASSFQKELAEIGPVNTLNIHINSCGGDVFEGIAIYNLIKQHKATKNVYVDGIAGSIASVIAMAGDNIYMDNTSIMMIHNCWTWTTGNAEELRKTADDMDKIMTSLKNAYLSKINIKEEDLQELLDNETYLTADECKEMGFCTEIIEYDENEEKLSASSKGYYNLVQKLKKMQAEKEKIPAHTHNTENKYAITEKEMPRHTHNAEVKYVITENEMDKIAEKISEKLKETDIEEKIVKKDLNENSFMNSFLNKFIEKI